MRQLGFCILVTCSIAFLHSGCSKAPPMHTRASPAEPSGPHPRIWLDPATLTTLREQRNSPTTGAARAIARCADARANPSNYADAGWEGFDWANTLSSCALAYQITRSPDDAATALVYLQHMLDDDWVPGRGQGGDLAVRHDTGYGMRTFGVYPALAYDWLHDAPGMTETLRAHARHRFAAWTGWYASDGYLQHMPGANYECGYLLAATLTAIAEAGAGPSDAGPSSSALWSTARDVLFGVDMVKGFAPGGVLLGGDWAEGWQYGPLSVLEMAGAARAMEEQGVALPSFHRWGDELTLRDFYASTPSHFVYVGGDTSEPTHYNAPAPEPLLATIISDASDTARAWARAELDARGLSDDFLVYQALAEARAGASTPFPTGSPTAYLAEGTRTLYARGDWTSTSPWGVFQSAPRQVADHQHPYAGNFVMSRGVDDLIVDPSPYGSRSTLTSNAPAIDSNVLPPEYHPSQAFWGAATDLTWSRLLADGMVVARGSYADQYRLFDTQPDIAVAIRDWMFIPSGKDVTAVVVDRVRTGDRARGLHLRFRTPASLVLKGSIATGIVGDSKLTIERVWNSSGTLSVTTPTVADGCDNAPTHGSCTFARFPVTELRLDVSGPTSGAIHVLDGTASTAAPSPTTRLFGLGLRGITFVRGGRRVAVLTNDAPNAQPGASFTYTVPADLPARHIVLDAPSRAGRSDVVVSKTGNGCRVSVRPHVATGNGFKSTPLVLDVGRDCTAVEAKPGLWGNDLIH